MHQKNQIDYNAGLKISEIPIQSDRLNSFKLQNHPSRLNREKITKQAWAELSQAQNQVVLLAVTGLK